MTTADDVGITADGWSPGVSSGTTLVSSLPVLYTSVELVMQTVPEIGSISNATSASIAQVAGMAEAVINAKLSALYAVPVVVTVPLLTTIATDLTIYRFFTRKPLVGDQSKSAPWFDRFKESSELLDQIASGDVPLVGADGMVVDASAAAPSFFSTTDGYLPTFDEGAVEAWEQDELKRQDNEDKHG